MISGQRLTYLVGVAAIEVVPASLLLTLWSGPINFALLVGVALAGALFDWLSQLWLPAERQSPALAAAALLTALWLVKGQIGGGYNLHAGWDATLDVLLSLQHPRNGRAYLVLLVALYSFWRGTRLFGHDSASLRRLFARVTVAFLAIITLGLLSTASQSPVVVRHATLQVLLFFPVALITIALASAAEQHDAQLRRLGWRGLATFYGAALLVLACGLVFVTLFGDESAQIARAIWRAFLVIVLLIALPIVMALVAVLERLFSLINFSEVVEALRDLQNQQQQQQAQTSEQLSFMPAWLVVLLQSLLALLPILALIALFLLARQRRRRTPRSEEERQSLWSWNAVASDLRGLLAGLRSPFGHNHSLRDTLTRLRGSDPASRIRRSYIRLLLAGEAHQQPRAPAQTPQEYAPEAGRVLPDAAAPIATLTDAYERARYHPSSAADTDAAAAEQAWQAIDDAERHKR